MATPLPGITYYRLPDRTISFRLVADQYIHHLKKAGLVVQEEDLQFKDSGSSPSQNPIAVLHPLFYYRNWGSLDFDGLMSRLKVSHRYFFGMEVADSTSISPRFTAWANHPSLNGIMVPSRFSLETFRTSGVKTPLGLVPHGVQLETPSDHFDFLKTESVPKVLTFALHEPFRKGWDLMLDVIASFPDVLFIVKGPQTQGAPKIQRQENILLISDWLSASDLSSLYKNADVFMSLHRGGAFELNCLEALASGLPVIATGHGCVLDYLDEKNSSLVKIVREEPLWPNGGDHDGLGATVDTADAILKLDLALKNLNMMKDVARKLSKGVREQYSWDQVTAQMIAFMGSCIKN